MDHRPLWLTLALALLLISGCRPAANPALPTIAPTIALATAAPLPAPSATTPAYPVLVDPQQPPNPGAYPAGPGLLGGQVRENRARVTARLLEQAAAEAMPGYTRLHVLVLASEEAAGGFTAQLVNQPADFFVENGALPALAPGDTFSAEVIYQGDERGGAYRAENLTRVSP